MNTFSVKIVEYSEELEKILELRQTVFIEEQKVPEEEEIDDLQNAIYQIAKGNEIEPRDFFKVLYQIILSTTKGPKIGPFILDIGRKNVSEKLSAHI